MAISAWENERHDKYRAEPYFIAGTGFLKLKAMIGKACAEARAKGQPDLTDAASFANRIHVEAQLRGWKQAAILLKITQGDPQPPALLADSDKASLDEAVLGLIAAVEGGGQRAKARWESRIDKLDADYKAIAKDRMISLGYLRTMFLVKVAAGRPDQAKAIFAGVSRLNAVTTSASKELVDYSRKQPDKAAREAAKLLKASAAIRMNMKALGVRWAMEVLDNRHESQWAAGIVVDTQPNEQTQVRILALLVPDDCPAYALGKASLLTRQRKYAEAATQYRIVVNDPRYPNQLGLKGHLAMVLQSAGGADQLIEAKNIYLELYQATKDPGMGNSAAYLMAIASAPGSDDFNQAEKLADTVYFAHPRSTLTMDTLGWIAHLKGDNQRARPYLRRAVKGLIDMPEVHYHLGKVEAETGQVQMARWHLERAVALVEERRALGLGISPEAADAGKKAARILGTLPIPARPQSAEAG